MEPSAAGGDPHPSPSGGVSPSPPPPPPPLPPSGWLAGLVSGAGRLLASVLGPDDSSSSPTGSGSTALGGSASSSSISLRQSREGHYGGADLGDSLPSPLKNNQLNQSEKKTVLKDYTEASFAIVSDIEPKDAIMQLLMQETYTRSECSTLIKIIQERVVDPDIALPISWKADRQPTLGYSLISPNGHGFDNNAAAAADPTLTPVNRGLFNHNADNMQSSLKRSYSAVQDTPEDLRRVRTKIDGNPINITKFKQVDVVRNRPGFSGDAIKLLSDAPLLGANNLAHFNIVSKFERVDDIFDEPNKILAIPSQCFDSNSSLAGADQKNNGSTFFKSCPTKGLKNGFPLKVEPLNDLIPFEQKMVDLSHQNHKDAACDDSGSVSKLMFMKDIGGTPSLPAGSQLQNGSKNRRRKHPNSPRVTLQIPEPPAMGTRKPSSSPRTTPKNSESPAMVTRKQSSSPRTTPKISESPAMGTRRKVSDATVKAEIDLLEQISPVSADRQDPDYVPEKRPVGRPRKVK